jgi:peptidoglycan hydrolase-like protein with peptidoglycan-binding domain
VVVKQALKWNGWGDGSGYPGKSPNPACEALGRPLEYSCADGVTYSFFVVGLPLVSMTSGLKTGYAYCPYGLATAHDRHAVINSWQTRPADILFVQTGSGAQPGHTEMVVNRDGEWVESIGWDSGPSNVDHHTGQGGVHLHKWFCPKGQGNASIMAAADASKLVSRPFGSAAEHVLPSVRTSDGPRMLMLKSPNMHGKDVSAVQKALGVTVSGTYDEQTEQAVRHFQRTHKLAVDGTVGPDTRAALKATGHDVATVLPGSVRGQIKQLTGELADWGTPVSAESGDRRALRGLATQLQRVLTDKPPTS